MASPMEYGDHEVEREPRDRNLMTSIACVIPTHGRPEHLRRAMTSVLEQTRPADEVIVVDDLSCDETRRIVASFSTTVPVRLAQPDIPVGRRSASTSRNLGALLASSGHLAFLDDDDHWDPRFLEELIEVVEREHVSLVCSWVGVESQGCTIRIRRPRFPGRAEETMSSNPGLTGSNFLISRAAFDRIGGFDPGLPVANDLDFLVRALGAGIRPHVVPLVLAYQTTDGHGHLSSRGAKRADGIAMYLSKYREALSRDDVRRLRRARYVALRYPGQNRLLHLKYFVLTVLLSRWNDWTRWARRIMRRDPSEYA